MAKKELKVEGEEPEVKVEVDALTEESAHSTPTGAFVVKEVGEGKFRLYNEVGQAVSPVVSEATAILGINKACSRANALKRNKVA